MYLIAFFRVDGCTYLLAHGSNCLSCIIAW